MSDELSERIRPFETSSTGKGVILSEATAKEWADDAVALEKDRAHLDEAYHRASEYKWTPAVTSSGRPCMFRSEVNEVVAALEQRVEGLGSGLGKIVEWSKAYPLDVFPEPDFKKAAELLKAGGMTLDAISASNMRHVVKGVGKIAEEALHE